VTVFAVHPAPPQMRADWLADYRLMRTQVATALASGEPVVLAGDLNAAPTNGPLRRLLGAGLTDTATATRWTWQDLTWPADRPFPPVIRIDHVLAGGGVTPSRLAAVAIPGTDHRAVVADLLLPAGGRPTP